MKRTIVYFVAPIFFLSTSCKGQIINIEHKSIVELKHAFNNSVSQGIKNEGMDWSTAVLVSDAANNNISNKNFINAEHYIREIFKDLSMSAIDSYIQKEVIISSFTTCPELSIINISDKSGAVKYIQNIRPEIPDPRINPRETAVTAGFRFGNKLIKVQIDSLTIAFEDYNLYKSEEQKLKQLASKFKQKKIEIVTENKDTKEMRVILCSFIEDQNAIAQVQLSFKLNDSFAKIQKIEFIPEDKIHFEWEEPPPPMKKD